MAKRSRRARRQQSQQQRAPATPPVETPVVVETPEEPAVRRKTVDFVQVYGYVYKELRNVFIIAVLMFIVLVGLSYVIS